MFFAAVTASKTTMRRHFETHAYFWLSAGTARTDLRVKLEEYRALESVDTIVFVDIAAERVRVVQRRVRAAGTSRRTTRRSTSPSALDLVIPHDEIFARD
ncbi:hypothetical protein AB5I41_07010 [Sphingomonas sp. MMS24-JH45]